MSEAILIVDLGSTRVKSTLFSLQGQVLARAGDTYPTAAPRPTWAEQEPAHWWEATVRATREALRQSERCTVMGIGVTGQMHGLVALDRDGRTLGPCLTVQDRRAAEQVREIEDEAGARRTYAITGARLDAASPAAKLRWLARHRPTILERCIVWLPPKDYLRYRLTGEVATEPIDAAGTLLYDLGTNTWSDELAEAACVDPRHLPPLRPGHTPGGVLTREAAAALGLQAGIPVAIGAGDDVECLGAGLLAPGRALEHLGTTGSILACSPRVVTDQAMRVDCYPHAVPGLYLVGGSTGSAGATLAWAAQQLVAAPDGVERSGGLRLNLTLDSWDDESEALLFLPYLAGERCPLWDPTLRGLLAGMTLRTTAHEIARAVFSGVAFSLRHILDTLLDLGLAVEDLVASGDDGAAADATGAAWSRLRSAVYGRPLLLAAESDPTAAGALVLTLVAIGAAPDIATAARVIPPLTERVTPDPAIQRHLARRYALYRDLAAWAAPLFARWHTEQETRKG